MRELLVPLLVAITGAIVVAVAFFVSVGQQGPPLSAVEPLVIAAIAGFEAAESGGMSPWLLLGAIVGICLLGISGLFFIEVVNPTFRGRRISADGRPAGPS